MPVSHRVALALVLVIVSLLTPSLFAAVSFTFSGSASSVCPGTANAPLGRLQLFSSGGGTIGSASSVTISVTSAAGSIALTGTPAVTWIPAAPAGATFSSTASTLTFSFTAGTTISANTTVTVTNLFATVPSTETNVVASLVFSGDLAVTNNSSVLAFVTNNACGGRIGTSVTSLEFAAAIGSSPPPKSFTITNATRPGQNLGVSLSATSSPSAWLIVETAGEGAGVTNVTVRVESPGLPEGTYNGSITITSALADNSPLTIPVTLKIGRGARIDLSTTKLTFIAEPAKDPPPQNLVVTNGGTGILNPEASAFVTRGAWLFVIAPVELTEPAVFKVTVSSAQLAPGTYTGTVVVTSAQAINSPQTVAVELIIKTASPTIALSAKTLAFTSDAGKNPDPQTFTVTNSDVGMLAWQSTVNTAGGNWLTLSPTSGTAPTTVTASVSVGNLQPGVYNGTITISSTSEGITNSPQSISVTLTVASGGPVITLSASSLTFTVLPGGGPPASQTVSLTNTGGGTLAWATTVATVSGGAWLSVTPTEGTAPSTLTVAVDPSRVPTGTHTGTISIRSTGTAASNTPQVITVQLKLEGPKIQSGGIRNAASAGTNGLSPGAIISIFGSNLATAQRSATPGQLLPEELGGTVLRIGSFRARLFFVSPTQINAQVPVELTDATAAVRVSVAGLESDSVTLNVLPFDPGLFTFTGEPGGPAAALKASDFSPIGSASPAQRGSIIVLYGTGMGPVIPSVSSGQPGSAREPLNQTVEKPIVLIGDKSARVLFSGLAPNFVGLYQFNVEIPADAPTGDSVPVIVGIGGRGTNTARLAIR